MRVITEYMGGGFGSKFGPDVQGISCARLAKLAGAPVKLMLDRKEEHLAGGYRPSAAARIRAGVGADGKLTGFEAESWGTGGAGAGADFPLPYIYQFPNRRRVHTDVFINAGQQRAMAAPHCLAGDETPCVSVGPIESKRHPLLTFPHGGV